jgi:hypothetical protein
MIAQISRDPFARTTVERESERNLERAHCAWCGEKPRTLFRYRYADDQGHNGRWSRQFCGVECYRSFQP